jgi:kynurenine 3-monooxygenase
VSLSEDSVCIIGAGPTGALLAILLRRLGMQVVLYESRPDPRRGSGESGRSINLALADRGIHALSQAGVLGDIEPATLPMRGRLVHALDGTTSLQPYGQRPNEILHAISRHRLNQVLLDVALRRHGVQVHFEHRMEGADFAAGAAHVRDLRSDRILSVPMRPLLICDGAGSLMRRRMSALGLIDAREAGLDHGYKELTIPAGEAGLHRIASDVLHIWPRGDYMLIALPNQDGSFTATLFLPNSGAVSFESLTDAAAVERFVLSSFPDVCELMPRFVAEFQAHPTGFLGTVYTSPWHYRGMAALVGDSAHAIVPFHGQGMNCCFEDCVEFAECAGRHSSWGTLFADFFSRRKPNTDAIAAMASENYLEMRERVADPRFQLQQALALALEKRYPRRFIPRYSMVMFHHEIPYLVAQQRGGIQAQLLTDLTAGVSDLADVDFKRAEREIESRLPPIA